jgi:hypothetical protein
MNCRGPLTDYQGSSTALQNDPGRKAVAAAPICEQ